MKYLVFALLCLAAIYGVRVYGEYLDCRIAHRSGYFLLTDRQAIKEACRLRLDPFIF